jgi:glutathione S-transferase
VVEPASRNAPLTESSGIWAALAAYFGPAHVRPSVQPEVSAWQDEDDFSAEHGYEPGVEGRTEFEHGEFDRWV